MLQWLQSQSHQPEQDGVTPQRQNVPFKQRGSMKYTKTPEAPPERPNAAKRTH